MDQTGFSEILLLFLQGWTKFYEFAFGDLRAGADIIDRLCTLAGMGKKKDRVDSIVTGGTKSKNMVERTIAIQNNFVGQSQQTQKIK